MFYSILKHYRYLVLQAYQRLAKQFHPDKNPDPAAGEKMKEISYVILALFSLTSNAIHITLFGNS